MNYLKLAFKKKRNKVKPAVSFKNKSSNPNAKLKRLLKLRSVNHFR